MTPRDESTAIDSNYWKGPDQHGQRTVILDYLNRSIREDNTFNTLKTNQGSPSSSPSILDGFKLRRLTPIECERLQGFPDRWTEGLSDTQRYRLLGNAVTVNVVEHLGKLIMSEITNESDQND